MLILSIESGCMCKHQGSSEQLGSNATLSRFLQLNRVLCGIKHDSTPYLEKKENNSAEKEGFLYASFPPPSCQKQGKWKHRKQNPDRLCTMHYILVYPILAAKKRLLQTRPYSEALSKMNLQESRILLSKISTPFQTFLIPFFIIKAEF